MCMNNIKGPGILLREGWALFTNHSKVIIPIVIFPSVLSIIANLLVMTKTLPLLLIGILVSITGSIMSLVMIPAVVNATHRFSTEPGVALSFGKQYRFGFSLFWSIALVSIISVAVSLGSYVLLIVPGIIVSVYASFWLYALVIDGKRGFSALTESYSLVKGRWGSVFGRMFLVGLTLSIGWVILLGLAYLIGLLTGIPIHTINESGRSIYTTNGYILVSIANLIGYSIFFPVGIGASYGLYNSLKATRQAEDTVSSAKFCTWLKVFIGVGIFAVLMIFVIGFLSVLNQVRNSMVVPVATNGSMTPKIDFTK